MPPISNELAQALEPLTAQIKAAEKLLNSLPSVEYESFFICESNDVNVYLEFGKMGQRTGLLVVHVDKFDEELAREWLESVKIDQRLKIAGYLPEFLDECYKHVAALPKKAIDTAKKLEDKLAEIENRIAIDEL